MCVCMCWSPENTVLRFISTECKQRPDLWLEQCSGYWFGRVCASERFIIIIIPSVMKFRGYIGYTVYVFLPVSVLIFSGLCFLKRSNIWIQVGYGGVLSWDGVSCGKKKGLSSRSRSHWGLIWSKYDFLLYFTASTISFELPILLQPNLVWWYIIIS